MSVSGMLNESLVVELVVMLPTGRNVVSPLDFERISAALVPAVGMLLSHLMAPPYGDGPNFSVRVRSIRVAS